MKLCKAQLIPVPDTFIRQCFNQLEAVDWIDGFNRPVTNFGAYVKKGYAQHKDGKSSPLPRFSRPEPEVKRQGNGKVSTGINYDAEGGK